MKKYFIILLILLPFCKTWAQKKVLDIESFKNWPEVTNGGISNNGKFAFYEVKSSKPIFIVQATNKSWRQEFTTVYKPSFTSDSRFLIGTFPNDTLFAFDLQKKSLKKISAVNDYKIFNNGTESLLYTDTSGTLVLSTFKGGNVFSYPKVDQYQISLDGKSLLLLQDTSSTQGTLQKLSLIDTQTGTMQLVHIGFGIGNFIFDNSGGQIAYMLHDDANVGFWHYMVKDKKNTQLLNNYSSEIDSNLTIDAGQFWRFSKDGKFLFFSFKEKPRNKKVNPELEIWNYKDAYLKSYYYGKINGIIENFPENEYLGSINLSTHKFIQLLHSPEKVVLESFKMATDSMLLIQSSFGPSDEEWNSSARISYLLCFTKTGKLIPIELNRQIPLNTLQISPDGKYIIYFDPIEKSYCSYVILTGQKYKLTKNLPANYFAGYSWQEYPWPERMTLGVVGWFKYRVIVQGTYDLWGLDLLNATEPINLTHGKGEQEKTVFFLANQPRGEVVDENEKLLLSAFNLNTKDYGFYTLSLSDRKGLKKIHLAPNYCNEIEGVYTQLSRNEFMKAKNAPAYLIRTQKVDQSPNYFFTHDLEDYEALSNVRPEKEYNWITSELHNYKDSLGNSYQGVLYKPQNFDQNKTYPIIFYIYDQRSNLLNSYPMADDGLRGICSVPLMVSNGYLVFMPDMKRQIKYPRDRELRSVIAAADHLEQFPWVNHKKMGITGASFGGYETNYIITHTNRFAAAISGSGVSDMISQATMLRYGNSNINSLSMGTSLMGATLPEDPKTYIRNSPILQSINVKTPLLLVHNAKDDAVDYRHSQSFFIVLRSLRKKVWWLNYKNEKHGLSKLENRADYHKRALEFWNHFLQDQSEPSWMNEHLSVTNR